VAVRDDTNADFALPQRFKLSYVGQDGKEYAPIMLHRVILGSMERFIGALIEHYGGAFPVWLSPVQVVIIPIADEHKDYARKVAEILRDNDIRVEIDDKNARMQHKIREAEVAKAPYMLIVGGKRSAGGRCFRQGEKQGRPRADETG